MTDNIIDLGERSAADNKVHKVQLKASALTTHAVIVGSTGSGKSGLIIGMVEEFIRLGIPSFLVDIKGDIANIALQPPEIREKMALRFLTPGGTHGEAVNIFSGIENTDRVTSTVTAIYKLMGIKAEPTSTQHTFMSTIIQTRLSKKMPCTIVDIFQDVSEPPFEYLGLLPLEEVFPKQSRAKLAARLNNLIAAPSFQAWREGISLDINSLMQCETGKTPVVVYSVAHIIDDTERVFAISMFLEEMQSWVRQQPGTSNLKSCLLLDEMFGVMPPHPANPPTKKPLLTMLKQARAHGLGIVICSQNPMDLDYKGMSNAQTWLVGRLQTSNDRRRIVDGVCSATAADSHKIDTAIASLKQRQFLLVRPTGNAVFNTRDCTAELRGPMSPMEIKKLLSFGVADEVQTLQDLKANLERARARWAEVNTDANWADVEAAQDAVDSHTTGVTQDE